MHRQRVESLILSFIDKILLIGLPLEDVSSHGTLYPNKKLSKGKKWSQKNPCLKWMLWKYQAILTVGKTLGSNRTNHLDY